MTSRAQSVLIYVFLSSIHFQLSFSSFVSTNFNFSLLPLRPAPHSRWLWGSFFLSYICHSLRCRSCPQIHLLYVRFLPSFPLRVSPSSLRNPPCRSSIQFAPLGRSAHAALTVTSPPLVHNPTLHSEKWHFIHCSNSYLELNDNKHFQTTFSSQFFYKPVLSDTVVSRYSNYKTLSNDSHESIPEMSCRYELNRLYLIQCKTRNVILAHIP